MSSSPPKPVEKLLWDSPEFSKMYLSAEKITSPFSTLLLQNSGIERAIQENFVSKLVILDQACGTGVVTKNLISMLAKNGGMKEKQKPSITCADFADSMVDFVAKRSVERGWGVEVLKCDAQNTKLPDSKYTHILFNFGPFLLPSPSAGLSECHRMLTPTGTLAFTTWSSVPWIADFRAAFATNSSLPIFPETGALMQSFSSSDERWDSVEAVRGHFVDGGFVDVRVERRGSEMVLRDVDEFLAMLPGTLGIVKRNFWSEEEVERWDGVVEGVVERWMRERYGRGEVRWEWVAVVATGRKGV